MTSILSLGLLVSYLGFTSNDLGRRAVTFQGLDATCFLSTSETENKQGHHRSYVA